MSEKKIWIIEEVGDYSLLLCSADLPPYQHSVLFPNPDAGFIKKYGRYDYSSFLTKFGVKAKEMVHTPEKLIVYFEDKAPEWAREGMQIVI